MKRPLAVIGFSYLAASAAALLFGEQSYLYMLAASFSGALISIIIPSLRKNKTIPAVMISSFTAVLIIFGYTAAYIKPAEKLGGKTAEVTAVLCDLPYHANDRNYYKLRTTSVDLPDTVQNVTITVSSVNALDIQPYDTIRAEIEFYNSYRYRYSSLLDNIEAGGHIVRSKPVKITKSNEKPFGYYVLSVRKEITDIIRGSLPQRQFSLVTSILTGDKTHLSSSDKDNIRGAGLSHIIAVSGFHLSVFTGLIFSLIFFLSGHRTRLTAFVCISGILFYMGIAGFSSSVVRAGIMQIIFYTGLICLRKPDSLNSLGFSVLFICIVNPMAASDVGLLLSFSATLGIITMAVRMSEHLSDKIFPSTVKPFSWLAYYPKGTKDIRKRLKKRKKLISGFILTLCVPIAAWLFTFPVAAVFLDSFSVYSVISSLITEFAVSLIIVSALLMVGLSASVIFSFLTLPFRIACGVAANYIFRIAEFVSGLPFNRVTTGISLIVLFAVLLLSILYATRKRNKISKWSAYAFTGLLALYSGICSYNYLYNYFFPQIAVLDVGDGTSVVYRYKDDTIILSCGGDYYRSDTIEDYLEDRYTENISYMLLQSPDEKDSGYCDEILENYNVRNLQIYDEDRYYERTHSLFGNAGSLILYNTETDSESNVSYGDISIYTSSTENRSYSYTDTGKAAILIVHDQTDCTLLPSAHRKADIIVINGSIKHTELLDCNNVIISDGSINKCIYSPLVSEGRNIYCTSEGGNIIVDLISKEKLHIGREIRWLK